MFDEMKQDRGEGLGGLIGLILDRFGSIIAVVVAPAEVAGLSRDSGREAPRSALTGRWVLLRSSAASGGSSRCRTA